jgi:hypothetical protein
MSVEPFRGSAAVAAGLVTPGQLRGRASAACPPTVRSRSSRRGRIRRTSSCAAYLLVADRGLGRLVATEILGASCGPAAADVEGLVPVAAPAARAARPAGRGAA